jgi:imidazoleglycerol-phosphate dehydratase
MLGDVACENLDHFFRSLAAEARITLHIDLLKGRNDHHRAEAAFKATALALREAITRDTGTRVPSTKGVLA